MSDPVRLPFEKLVLDNGLQVVLHEDHSNPVVAVCVVYHVGSGREIAGKSGLAHLFEHLMFEGSLHIAEGEHFQWVNEAGGTLNGTTNRDRTNYFETLPAHQLELALWLESDRMGFLLPALTQEKLDNQRDVVKNERRQNYENRPYAKALWPICWSLYPDGHPYRWLTIGSHEDLDAASLEDVHDFFRRWYGPNNATLTIGGDFDRDAAIALVRRYFEPIPRGPEVPPVLPRAIELETHVRRVVEDEVQLPELTVVWPVPPRFSEEDAAIRMLLSILSANQAAILDKALMVDEVLCSRIYAYVHSGELNGEFRLVLRAAPGVSLTTLEIRLRQLFDEFSDSGVDPEQLQRMRNSFEAGFVQGLETVEARTDYLAEMNALCGDPGHAERELRQILEVSPQAIERVFVRYIHQRPALWMSVVPVGRHDLAASGADRRQVEQEEALDRSKRPRPGSEPELRAPAIRHHDLLPGCKATSTPYSRLPMVAFELCLQGGHQVESLDTLGLSLLTAECMCEGTKDLTTTAFREALDGIGAQFRIGSHEDEISLSVVTLTKHLDRALELFRDVLLEPRFEAQDFARLKQQRLSSLATRGDHARTIADIVWRRLIYGVEPVAAYPRMGTQQSVSGLTVEQVREFHARYLVAKDSSLAVAGDLDEAAVTRRFQPILRALPDRAVEPAPAFHARMFEGRPLYFVHKKGAAQTELRIGHAGPARTAADFELTSAMNYVLGGSFNSRLNSNLREDKGYTYGIHSALYAGLHTGYLLIASAVRSEVTADAVREILAEVDALRDDIHEDEARSTAQALILALGRKYEPLHSLCNLQLMLSKFDLGDDYLEQRVEILRGLTRVQLLEQARSVLYPSRLAILAVGDSAVIREPLEALLGPATELDVDGNRIA